mmetsp:Transcript_30601/g.52858  ORF Transcript_30601/g.52858 Transcript_30601/m.52858 type:complete len:722 (+) Transcript_30601:90-2255(+)
MMYMLFGLLLFSSTLLVSNAFLAHLPKQPVVVAQQLNSIKPASSQSRLNAINNRGVEPLVSSYRGKRAGGTSGAKYYKRDEVSRRSAPNDATSSIEAQQKNSPQKAQGLVRYLAYGVSPSSWEFFLSKGREFVGKPGDVISSEDNTEATPRELCLILEGAVALEAQGWPVIRLGPGNFLGEGSFVRHQDRGGINNPPGPRSATSRCVGAVRALLWAPAELEAVFAEDPGLRAGVQAYWNVELARKLRAALRRFEDAAPSSNRSAFANVTIGNYGYVLESNPSGKLGNVAPASGWALGVWNFGREFNALRRSFRFAKQVEDEKKAGGVFSEINKAILSQTIKNDIWLENNFDWYTKLAESKDQTAAQDPEVARLRAGINQLVLDNAAIWRREEDRRAALRARVLAAPLVGQAQKLRLSTTPWLILAPYYFLCWVLDFIFDGRPIQRFWFLETIARMPYFSYLSMLHLYETLGWWTVGEEVRKVHFAEEWNELRHLKIMQSLGGDAAWADRFFARHAAILYYWLLNLMFSVSPRAAYNFSELIEFHAVDSYGQFLEENEELLRRLPPPKAAVDYYMSGDMYLFDEFQTSRAPRSRRPKINNLYDVFRNIMEDELEHVKTVTACQISDNLGSPNLAAADGTWSIQDGEEQEEENKEDSRLADILSEDPGYQLASRYTSSEDPGFKFASEVGFRVYPADDDEGNWEAGAEASSDIDSAIDGGTTL